MSSNRGMGRGLAAILSVSEAGEHDGPELRELHVELVAPNPDQPRKRFDDEALQALADSVKERGVLQPVLVRPRAGGSYEIVAGERRLEGLGVVALLDEGGQRLEAALVENMAREDLNPIEAARAVAASWRSWGSRARTSAAASAAAASRCRTCCACSTCPTRRSSCSPAASSPRATAARS